LGGLISSEMSDTVTKIPILGDIPLIGRYLFSSVNLVEQQRELIVLMTPYVMTNQADMLKETKRLYEGTSLLQKDWGRNSWSESTLRKVPDPDDFEENQRIPDESTTGADQNTPSAEINSSAPSSTEQQSDKEEIDQLLDALDQ
jgi:general secretion pathway protein D